MKEFLPYIGLITAANSLVTYFYETAIVTALTACCAKRPKSA